MRKTLTDKGVAALKPRAAALRLPRPRTARPLDSRAAVRRQELSRRSTRGPDGKQVWTTLGSTDSMPIAEARDSARTILQRVRARPAGVRTQGRDVRRRRRHVAQAPCRGERAALGAGDQPPARHACAASVEGPRVHLNPPQRRGGAARPRRRRTQRARQADYVLNVVRSIMFWHAARRDDYSPPIVRGMKRQQTATPCARSRRRRTQARSGRRPRAKAARSRDRAPMLADGAALPQGRDDALGRHRRRRVDGSAEPREKDTGGALALARDGARHHRGAAALRVESARLPRARRSGPFVGFASGKAAFDAKLPDDMAGWMIHDLRRTARSLMSRAGVSSEHAERVMGHAIGGVEGIYDRHTIATRRPTH